MDLRGISRGGSQGAVWTISGRTVKNLTVERVGDEASGCPQGHSPYVPTDSRTGAWRCNVEGIINGDRLRVVVELPKEPPDLLVVTVIDLGR